MADQHKVEWPARCISLRFTHPTAGDDIFCFMVEKAVAEYAALNRCDGPETFTASNGVIVELFVHDND